MPSPSDLDSVGRASHSSHDRFQVAKKFKPGLPSALDSGGWALAFLPSALDSGGWACLAPPVLWTQ